MTGMGRERIQASSTMSMMFKAMMRSESSLEYLGSTGVDRVVQKLRTLCAQTSRACLCQFKTHEEVA